jgi:hypothetical protein
MEATDKLALRGEYLITRADFSRELALAARHPLIERPRILAELAPCIDLEHRGGVCPMGHTHGMQVYEGHNTIVTVLRQSIINQLVGNSATNLLITQIAAGTSSTATLITMTQLAAEYYRTAPSSAQPGSPVTTQALAYWFFGTAVANAGSDLQEWGIMAGGATSGAGTGSALARFLQAFTKNNLTTASGQYTLNIA